MMSKNLYTKETMNSEMFDIESEQYIETPWSVIESYFSGQQLERFVRHQLESYNNFVCVYYLTLLRYNKTYLYYFCTSII